MSRRSERVGDLIRTELARLLRQRMSDPRVGLATVSSVDLSPDLRRAVVRISALGGDEERRAAVEALRHARGFLRNELAHTLRSLRVIPELVFELDRGAEHSQRISDLLEELHGHDEST